MKRILLITSLVLVGLYSYFTLRWLHVKFVLTTGIDFVVLDNPAKVKMLYGIVYQTISTDVQTTTDAGYLRYGEYYLYGEFSHLTCDAAPNCKGGNYMHLVNCFIIPAFVIKGIGILTVIVCCVTLLLFVWAKIFRVDKC